MKIFLTSLCVLCALSVTAQQNQGKSFVLKGKLQNAPNSKLALQNKGRTTFIDSTTTDSGGNFLFKGVLKEPDVFLFGLKGTTNYVQLQMENSVITLNGDAKDLRHTVRISGSKDQALSDEFNKLAIPSDENMKEIEKAYAEASLKKDSVTIKELTDVTLPKWKDTRSDLMARFISMNPNSAVSIGLVADFVNGKYGPVEKADQLMRVIEATPAGKYSRAIRIRDFIDGQMSARSGKTAPVFTQPDTTGRIVSLADLKGKYILVDFWASWCHPCRAENPNVLKAYNTYKEKNFTVVAISLDINRNAWIRAIKEDHLPWLQLSDLKSQNVAGKQYGVVSIPANFLLDPSGKIIATDLRGEALERKLDEVLKNYPVSK